MAGPGFLARAAARCAGEAPLVGVCLVRFQPEAPRAHMELFGYQLTHKNAVSKAVPRSFSVPPTKTAPEGAATY
ncbi:MAG: hypothetical protein K0Q43_5706 [Ramlibacter sp.]|jgi:hypothetical protein|nr:hypothetical protein [Ramlibacter sp.]